jgi:hypothetical protein
MLLQNYGLSIVQASSLYQWLEKGKKLGLNSIKYQWRNQ